MGVSDSAQTLWCREAWDSPGSVSAAAQPRLTHMKDGGKHSHRDALAEAMAASALSHAAANDASSASVRTLRQRRGDSEASDTSKTQDVGRNTVQEKTLEFFQMCDMENKGFITRGDMQVRF